LITARYDAVAWTKGCAIPEISMIEEVLLMPGRKGLAAHYQRPRNCQKKKRPRGCIATTTRSKNEGGN
jgi:hypothetical protein